MKRTRTPSWRLLFVLCPALLCCSESSPESAAATPTANTSTTPTDDTPVPAPSSAEPGSNPSSPQTAGPGKPGASPATGTNTEPTPSPAPPSPGSGGAAGTGPNHGSGAGGADSAGGMLSTGGMLSAAGAPVNPQQQPTPEPPPPGPRFIGRSVDVGDGARRFEWSGSGIVARFSGSGISVSLEDGGSNQFTLLVDGELQAPLVLGSGQNSYPLAENLATGDHVVELYRRTEASFGSTTFHGFEVSDGEILSPPAPKARSIEIIGDSITCGYGNEGESASCDFSADTENHYLTYGAIAARELGAELSTVAWSGKGIVYNYGEDTTDPLPALYDRALPTDAASRWDFSSQVDAVVINLGTNDFSTDGDPTLEVFRDRYVALLARVREVYPEAFVLCTVGPLLSGSDLDAARDGINAAIEVRAAAGDAALAAWEMNIPNDAPGCHYHPSVATHQAMAAALVAELQTHLQW